MGLFGEVLKTVLMFTVVTIIDSGGGGVVRTGVIWDDGWGFIKTPATDQMMMIKQVDRQAASQLGRHSRSKQPYHTSCSTF